MNPFYTPFWQSIFQPIQQRLDQTATDSANRNNGGGGNNGNGMGIGNWLGWLNPFRTATFRNQQIFQQPQNPMQNFAGPTGRITPVQPMPPAQPKPTDYRGFNQARTGRMGPASNVGMGDYINIGRGKMGR